MDTPRKILVQGLFVLALIAGLMGPAAFTAQAVRYNLHPSLLHMARATPQQVVAVIVQKADASQAAEQQALSLGATVTDELRIINAFAAHMTAQAAGQLSTSPAVRWVSLDAPVVKSGGPDGTVDTGTLTNAYIRAIGADKAWAAGYQGSSVTVAFVDSGWCNNADFRATPTGGDMRLAIRVGFNGNETNLDDHYGHGVHVAGIIGGNGAVNKGKYIGVAPKVKLVSVKVNDQSGQASTSGVVAGLQWVYNNRAAYNIKVVNLSLNSTVAEPYNNSPLDAAVEVLWFNKVAVVVSAGNSGLTTLYPPANDPFVITVGATRDQGTAAITDDVVASFSAAGVTENGFFKPDILAPGSNIIAPLASGGAELAKSHPANLVDGKNDYFRMSGTSMAAAVTSGAVALLLQAQPSLNPDQVKYRLVNSPGKTFTVSGRAVPYLNVNNAINSTASGSANTGTKASALLTTGTTPITWNSVGWNSVGWNSVGWNSVGWNSVGWNSVGWNSDTWEP